MDNLPTHSIEAEQSVLGALMLDSSAFDRIDGLKQSDFFRHDHRVIFGAIAQLAANGKDADALSVAESLKSSGLIDQAGGAAYIGEIVKSAGYSGNVAAYAKIVTERALLRNVLQAYRHAGDTLADLSQPIEQRVHAAVSSLTDALDGASTENAIPQARDCAMEWVDYLERAYGAGTGLIGLPTGFADLDASLKGLCPGELIVIAARPSMGKSALALNICANLAMQGKGVFITSMEMPRIAVFNRLASYVQRVPYEQVRLAAMDEIGPHIAAFGAKLRDWNMAIDERPQINLSRLEASLRHHKRKYGLDIAMVDYLGLMDMPDGQNRAQAVGDITRGLKVLAGTLGIPIILLAQLNRDLEKRQDKRPIMADLRDSGAIEQDAHTILFLYRDEVYNMDSPQKGIAECIIGKARDSERGVIIPMVSDLGRMAFRDIDRSYFR